MMQRCVGGRDIGKKAIRRVRSPKSLDLGSNLVTAYFVPLYQRSVDAPGLLLDNDPREPCWAGGQVSALGSSAQNCRCGGGGGGGRGPKHVGLTTCD